jgi:hypothetical protein
LIHEDAARAAGVRWDPKSEWLTWSHFRNALSESFGSSLTREKAVAEWESLTHKLGKIDEYLDRIGQLSFLTKYNHDAVKDKVIAGLHKDLRIEWAKVQDKPEVLPLYMKSLRELGHRLEQANQYEKLRAPANTSSNTGGSQPQKQKKGKKRGEKRNDSSNSEKKDRPKRKDPAVELAGVSKELRDSRAKANRCLKCGKGEHKWWVCPETSPVTKVIASAGKKRKRNRSPSPAPEAKKPKAVGSLESRISYGETSSVEKPLLNVVDDEESDYPEIYD